MQHPDLARLRRRYGGGALNESDLAAEPVSQFRRWMADATEAGIAEPNAMVVATVSADGQPAARLVLLKGLDERGFVWFTSYRSRKARELDAGPRCSLVFPWHAIQRQVRVEGAAERVTRAETEAYFADRPRESCLGAWASPQSEVVASRSALDGWYDDAARRWPDGTDVPAPDFWGGYRVVPAVVEFWQGRVARLHDRLRYRRTGDGWAVDRLAP